MKKFFAMMLAVVLMMSMFSMFAVASAASNVYVSGTANVRSGPGLGYASLGQVNAGSSLNYLNDVSYDNRGVAWYRVSFGGSSAWVSSKYASLSNYGGIATYAAGGSNNPAGSAYTCYGTVYAAGNINVRTGPGLSYAQVASMTEGECATFLGNSSMDNTT